MNFRETNIGSLIIGKYSKFNLFFKIVLFAVLILGIVLWFVGNLVHLDRLMLVLISIVATFILTMIYYEKIYDFIIKIISFVL